MNNSSSMNGVFEQNNICSNSQTFCEALGITFESLSIVGLIFNSTLIILFLKFKYWERDRVAVHISPELIAAVPEKSFDWWDVTTNFIVFYVWIVNLFTLAYMCFMSINISLAHEMNHSNEDQYLEYMLHVLNISLIIFTVVLYSKCIMRIRSATGKVTAAGPAILDNFTVKRRKRNLRLVIHYALITLTFIFLVFSWIVYKMFDATYFIVALKKTAYFANSLITGLIFTVTNTFVKEDFLTLVCGKPRQEVLSTKTNHHTTKVNADNIN
uniref:Taste receptor type 2 n=1 Tax=Romanomermis culicivorax TaxID=13658 RepID=A0A915HSM1_ROMCU